MRYISTKNLDPESQELYSLIGTLAKQFDWYRYGLQTVYAKKRGAAIHLRHNYRAIMLEFVGFGDLFCQLASLLWDGRSIAQNNIGIDNCVTLNYLEDLPNKGLQLIVLPFQELS